MTSPSPTPATGAWGAVVVGWRGLRWWYGSVVGDHAYARYVNHLQATHPDTPVPTEGAFWRQRYADQDANPGARCC